MVKLVNGFIFMKGIQKKEPSLSTGLSSVWVGFKISIALATKARHVASGQMEWSLGAHVGNVLDMGVSKNRGVYPQNGW